MKRFNPTGLGLHSGAASDLVRRTLSQHGLMADDGSLPGGSHSFAMPDLGRLGMGSPRADTSIPTVPDGAEYKRRTFTCDAGSRDVVTYVPAAARTHATGLVVMLHGCTQTADDFAAGTGMNALADQHGFVVAYPEQSRGANAQTCWNWFSRGDQRRDRGEPAIIAGIARDLAAEHGVPSDAVFAAGLSAGAAMAVILGETYPDVFSAIGVHSGLPYQSARDVQSAFSAMRGDPQDGPAGTKRASTRTILFHGSADHTVAPMNGSRIGRGRSRREPGFRRADGRDRDGQWAGLQPHSLHVRWDAGARGMGDRRAGPCLVRRRSRRILHGPPRPRRQRGMRPFLLQNRRECLRCPDCP